MPTIVAVCPYCRAGGVRAPQSAVGASATCPKCGSSFTVMPSDNLPGWANPSASPTTSAQPVAKTTAPHSRPTGTEETKPTTAISDVTEPSLTAPSELKERTKSRETPAPAPAPVTSPASDDADEVTDFGLVVSLSALALVGVAVLATLFPFGRFIATAVAGLGFVGGLASLGAEGRAKTAGALAMGLHFIVLCVVVLAPSWLNLDPWRGAAIDDRPAAPVAFSHTDQHTSLTEWVDSSNASWQFKDVRVTVVSATVSPIELTAGKGVKKLSKEQYLQIVVKVKNVGWERGLDLTGWAVGQHLEEVQLTDSSNRTLKPATFEEGWTPESLPTKHSDKLFPDKWVEVRLIFAPPQPRIDYLRLVMPGTMFGFKEEMIKFQINSGSLILMAPPKK